MGKDVELVGGSELNVERWCIAMCYKDRIVSGLADRACLKIARKVVRTLQRMTDVLSGEDSPIENVWDEICVQVQGEYSFYWEVYVDVVDQIVASQIDNLTTDVRLAIWLQTDEGVSWTIESNEDESQEPKPFEGDIVTYISDYVMHMASTWSNERIRRYFGREW